MFIIYTKEKRFLNNPDEYNSCLSNNIYFYSLIHFMTRVRYALNEEIFKI